MSRTMYVKQKLHKNICLILCMLTLLIFFPISTCAKDSSSEIIRVGCFEGTYNMMNENGERSGYGYEYLQNIAGYTGWSYKYVNCSWVDCFNQLENGNIDIIGGISYTEKRSEIMLFSDIPMGEEKYYIYTDAEHADFSAADLSTLNGKKIGVLKGHIPETVLNEWEKKCDLNLQHVNISSVDETLKKMANHEIDCFVSVEESLWESKNISAVTNIGESDIFFVINKNRPDIKKALDSAMRRIRDDNPFYTVELYRRYLSAKSQTFLTNEETEWLAKHGKIKIGYLNNDVGVSILNPETGEVTGVISDYVNLAKNCLQGQTLNFELQGYDTRDEQLKALQKGNIDLIFHVSQNPYSAEINKFVLSDTVWTFNIAAITEHNSFDENSDNSVAIVKGNFALKAYISYNYPQWEIKEYETTNDILKAIHDGSVDCMLCNSGSVSRYLKDKKLHSFFLTKPADASFAIRQGEPVLLSIMNKTLMTMPTSKLSGAVVSYSNSMQKVTALDFIRDNVSSALVLLLLIVAIIFALWIKSIRNAKKATKLNDKLNAKKTQLEKALASANLQSEIIGSISKIYSFIYRINLQDETYEEVSPDSKVQKIAGTRGNFNEVKDSVIHAMVAEEYRPIIKRFIDLPNIPERLKDMDSMSIEYRTPQNTWQMAQIIVKKRDESGKVTDILYTVRQIDKQKQLENQYKQKLLFNSRVLSGLSTDYTIAFVLNLDTDNYEIAFNQSTNHAKSYDNIKTFREYVDHYSESFVLPKFKETIRQTLNSEAIKKRFASEDDYHFTFETTPNAAGLSCFQVHIVKEYDEGGHFAFLGFRSVDDVIKQERQYKQMLQNQLTLITSALPGGVKISNDDSTYSFKYVSEQFAAMLGYDSPNELIQACDGNIEGLVHPDDYQTGLADALDQYTRSDHYATTYRMRCKDGSYKYIEDRGRKVISKDGIVEHWNLILDKNDLMEKTIAFESERKANQSKTAFLSRMSHDMRTPLNGIIGLIKINMDHFDDIKLVRENYRKMQISADHLLSLVNDVLQMSKIEDGTVPMTREVIDFIELSQSIAVIIGQRAVDNGIQLEFELKKDVDLFPCVYGSPLHLRQIFLNIYSNCIKYNHMGGKIITTADFEPDTDDRCIFEWTISDTGIGMSREFLEHIFEPFVQEKSDARSVYQGIGLGMAIVKGLVKKMDGTIDVQSEEGVGSTFTVRIPFEIAPTPTNNNEKEEEITNADVRGLNLLLVEDNDLNAEIAKTLLEDAGAKITLVCDGKQAVEQFCNSDTDEYDAIIMDIMMPEMDGYEATKTIRSLDRPDAKTIPIIAMTANAFAEDAEKCLKAGMNAHLAKPLEIEKVKKTICDLVKGH